MHFGTVVDGSYLNPFTPHCFNRLLHNRVIRFSYLHFQSHAWLIVGSNHAVLVPQFSSGDGCLASNNGVDATNWEELGEGGTGGREKERGRREEKGKREGRRRRKKGKGRKEESWGWGNVPHINMKMCLTCILHIVSLPGPSPVSR